MGFYNARVEVDVGGAPRTLDDAGIDAGSKRADGFRNRSAVHIEVKITPGPLSAYLLRPQLTRDAFREKDVLLEGGQRQGGKMLPL